MKPLIVGNWKMYPTLSDSLVLAGELKKTLPTIKGVDIVLAPPLPWLVSVAEQWHHQSENISFAAQNIWPEDQGAYTGEVSAYMLKDIARYALIGHSERRKYASESNGLLRAKIQAALRWQMTPILCVGEPNQSLGQTGELHDSAWQTLVGELREALTGVSREKVDHIVIAYEPIWAIGNGNAATPEYAARVIAKLRAELAQLYGQSIAERVRFIYGGSVSASNAAHFLRESEITGLLPGSVSVKAGEFEEICTLASQVGA